MNRLEGGIAAATISPRRLFIISAFVVALSAWCYAQASAPGTIKEYAVRYPAGSQKTRPSSGSTHEIVFDERQGGALWVTGQNYDTVVRIAADGTMRFYPLPEGSRPHGITFDAGGELWVTLEFFGKVARLDRDGKINLEYDVRLDCANCAQKINTHPHGLAAGSDGRTLWYTGKATGTIGRITPDGKVETFSLPTVGSVPIHIKAGPDGNMWVTELVGNAIARHP